MEDERRWTATIEIRSLGTTLTVPARRSASDLLRDQIQSAVREAGRHAVANSDVTVLVYKTTKTHGTVLDCSFSVFRDERGEVRYQ